MHIQDGVLDPVVLGATGAAAVAAVTYAGWTVRRSRPRLGAATLGVGAVLVAHLLDVPLAGGATAHVVGGTLLAIALGPALGLLAMVVALAAEALLWGDGGATALGANVLVMGVTGVAVGWAVWRWLAAHGDRWRVPAAGLAGLASVGASSLVLVVLGVSVPVLPQLAWGAFEGAVTAAVVAVALAAWRAPRSAPAPARRLIHVLDGDLEAVG